MSDLNERLDQAFGTIEPGHAPVEAAMAQGRKIRIRRRAAVLAGSAAVIAAAVVAIPALAHHQALPAPSTSHVRVTVSPPGPHSPAGTIASGLIGTQPWYLRVESPGTKQCLITTDGLGGFECDGSLPQTDAADPIGFGGVTGNGASQYFVSYGVVRKDVAAVRVVLSDGTVLTPRPITLDGMRWVAFATPLSMQVDSLTAYSRTGEIATAIPFTAPGGKAGPTFSAWLRPGQAVPGRISRIIASGTADGQAWQVGVYRGPWGTCVEDGNGGYCWSSTPTPGTGIRGSGGSVWWGSAADSVSYVVITLKDGSTMRVATTAVGPQKFWAFSLSLQAQKGAHWTAYDAAGRVVATDSMGPAS